ncbi:MAG: PrpR N-terminal domain-containing protein [Synergistaceae bacterium]|jgi:transcriptional regulator with PAS, ATPase and Fis domain|nr:PrpR N-terminal domain-containing protein [Synergistaceae bacterium]
MEKIKILAIAPYEGLRDLLSQISKTRDDIDLSVFLGDLSKGLEQVQAVEDAGYEVILSRGGTAEMIQAVANVPVVEIGVSGFDVLRSIRLAQNYSRSFAIVGFPSITNSARTLCDLLQYRIDVFTIRVENDIEGCLSKLASEGFTMVIGDTTVVNRAKGLGLGGILIVSGPESVRASLDNAVELGRQIFRSNRHETLYKNVLEGVSQYVAIFEHSGKEIYSNFTQNREPPFSKSGLKKYIPDVASKGSLNVFLRRENTLWSLKGSNIDKYVAFYVEKTLEKYDGKIFRTLGRDQTIPDPLESYYGSSNTSDNPSFKARACGDYARPVFIRGEQGVGKETIAKIVHLNSSYKECPMIIVDCDLIDDKKWDAVIDGKNSLREIKGFTIFMKNIQHIPADAQKKLEMVLSNTSLCKDNRFIFSLTEIPHDLGADHFCEYLLGSLFCITICPPPLRERRHDIPSLASLYIGAESQKLTCQAIGFEKNAMEAMKQFEWPQNITQLKRVLNELLLLTKSFYISEPDVSSVLKSEEKSYRATIQASTGTLEEIIQAAIANALAAEGMNQTKAAKRLGISRSTMWKRLKGAL